MSSNLMDTSPGGESTQYESIKTVTEPHAKQGGQLSDAQSTSPTSLPANTNKTGTTHVTSADKIRYGQALSEGGMGGQTGPGHNEGGASTEGGYGGTEALERGADAVHGVEGEGVQTRREQGYGGGRDMDRNVGA